MMAMMNIRRAGWAGLIVLAIASLGCGAIPRLMSPASAVKSSNPLAFKKVIAYKKAVPQQQYVPVRTLVTVPSAYTTSGQALSFRNPPGVMSLPVTRYNPQTFPPLPVAPQPKLYSPVLPGYQPGSVYVSPLYNNNPYSPLYNNPGTIYTSPGYQLPGSGYTSPGYQLPGSGYTSPGYNLPGSYYSSPSYRPPTFYQPPTFYNPPPSWP